MTADSEPHGTAPPARPRSIPPPPARSDPSGLRARPILCDEATRNAAQAAIEFDDGAPLTVKGKADPIAVFRPTGALRERRDALARTPRGRARELDALHQLLEGVATRGAGGVAVLEGDAGTGKSLVVATALEAAENEWPLAVLRGAAQDVESGAPYFVWRTVFATLLGVSSHEDDVSFARALFPALRELPRSSEWRERLPLLNDVLGTNLPETELTAQLSGEVRADNTSRLLCAVLSSAAGSGPAVVVLEDAQWFDSTSWALLRAALRVPSLAIVITTRPLSDVAAEEAATVARAPGVTWLRLEALDLEATRALVGDVLGASHVPPEVAAAVHEKTAGNPLFVDQLALALLETRAVSVVDGAVTVAEGGLERLALPATLQSAVTSRIDRLKLPEQLTLKVASVIGRVFSGATLREVDPIRRPERDLLDTLVALDRHGIAARRIVEADRAEYYFRQLTVHEVAYGLLLEAQRRELHLSVASWYERHAADDLPSHYGLLAWHFQQGRRYERAVDYLERAAVRARAVSANREALGFLGRAMDLAADLGTVTDRRRARWELWLGDACHGLGRLLDAEEHLRRSAALFHRPMPRGLAAVLLGIVVHVVWQAWRSVLRRARRARPRDEGGGARDDDLLDAARAYQRMGEIAYFVNKPFRLVHTSLVALNLSEGARRSPELARAYANLAVAVAVVPLRNVADGYSRRGIDAAERLGDGGTLSYALTMRALVLYGHGKVGDAKDALVRANHLASRLGDTRRSEECEALLGHLLQLEGRFTEAGQAFGAVLGVARSRGDLQPMIWGLLGSFGSALYLGDLGENAPYAEEAAERVEGYPVLGDMIYAHGMCAVARRLRGDRDAARASAARAVELMSATLPTCVYALEGYCGATETAVALFRDAPRDAGLRALARSAVGQLFRFARVFPIARPRARLFQAVMLDAAGSPRKAQRAARISLKNAVLHHLPYDEVRARVELARQLAATPEGEEQRALADALATRLGASPRWAQGLAP